MDFIDELIEAESSMEIEMWVAEEKDHHAGNWRLYYRPEDYEGFSNWETYQLWRLVLWVRDSEELYFPENPPTDTLFFQVSILEFIRAGTRGGLFPSFNDIVRLVYAYGGCDFEELRERVAELWAGDER